MKVRIILESTEDWKGKLGAEEYRFKIIMKTPPRFVSITKSQ